MLAAATAPLSSMTMASAPWTRQHTAADLSERGAYPRRVIGRLIGRLARDNSLDGSLRFHASTKCEQAHRPVLLDRGRFGGWAFGGMQAVQGGKRVLVRRCRVQI